MSETLEMLSRPSSPELDEILGKPFKVLDDGFVRVIDYMGNDSSIVQAARVSYGAGTKKVHQDRGLIRYLMRHYHTTPFEMCEIKLHVRVPMDTWRQWIRHRTASVNEYSTRYSIAIDAAYTTAPHQWRLQATGNRQGSQGVLSEDQGQYFTRREKELQDFARGVYEERLEAGIAREQARKDLPLSTYTEAYWKIDLHNLFHFLWLRMDEHAQWEIRQYANIIGHEIVARWVPIAWEAFVDYRLNALPLTRIDREVIQAFNQKGLEAAIQVAIKNGLLPEDFKPGDALKRHRERQELEIKLQQLGLPIPWQQ